jgi:hypothetical protein
MCQTVLSAEALAVHEREQCSVGSKDCSRRLSNASTCSNLSRFLASQDGCSECDQAEKDADAEIWLAAMPIQRSEEELFLRSVGLSNALEHGISSVGSRFHAQGTCIPCIINFWVLQKKPDDPERSECKNGRFCSRCHEPHSNKDLRVVWRQRKRQRTAAASV